MLSFLVICVCQRHFLLLQIFALILAVRIVDDGQLGPLLRLIVDEVVRDLCGTVALVFRALVAIRIDGIG